ncbi:uncharacterized protein BDZ99DRAFT_459776 [Mytilinidion resinicola]|uniref:Asl1-like glycosyl hydrolase catalytic domain-containing protein n=1 Tax=Mytilinidion resinicola TaxID=574789 RepID=A0A6A6YYZ1_9PEZI|nr:uncharacterized protein BDZ99DRAFT_459776 [Mytilinidion resinicola]KAF2814041.1 hypothetical protein BDZ99DRAFT_459776 [Mytilinidion resinicola]
MISKAFVVATLALTVTLGNAFPPDRHRKFHHGHSSESLSVSSSSCTEEPETSTIVAQETVYKTILASYTYSSASSSHAVVATSKVAAVPSSKRSPVSSKPAVSAPKASSAQISYVEVSSAKASSKAAAPTRASATKVSSTKAAPTKTSSSKASSIQASAAAAAYTSTKAPLTPHGKKAGMSGGDAYYLWEDLLGWWWDYTPFPNKTDSGESTAPVPVPILWGNGHVDAVDKERFDYFTTTTVQLTDLPYVMGFYEPDCSSTGSSDMPDVDAAVVLWEKYFAPLKGKTLLGSPGMCKQADETWLEEFYSKISTPWDFTTVHINKVDMDGVNKDLDHYWDKYALPIWVTEFSCVQDNPWIPSTDQTLINEYISNIVPLLEKDDRVYAYAYSTGEGLAEEWKPVINGVLTESGQKYLDAISAY